ncbi:PREDICTED: zinc carboxypeptidase A 1-like [Dinoponera quadriceps]|uniref:Zinc carboxypeptidase A 1-like n=1 Tax=Dinoponera quadriceps TaxID=609295 RepID=A0A6P3Y6F2_DINQU|nr:PREDICTED: zinc carboxypeptidase A 1-like [Dinoponera quadriceps]
MVAPHKLSDFEDLRISANLTNVKIIISDVQELIDMSTPQNQSSSFDFISYHTLEEIYKNMDDLADKYPDKVQVIEAGTTYENRKIKGMKISFKPYNPGVFIEGGIYAREWITSALVMYMAHQILTSVDPDIRDMAESYDWYIFPSFNPDGYVYTHTTDRMWMKTLRPYNICLGSNPNRNWSYTWNYRFQSPNRCTDTFPGIHPFSEVETSSMASYIFTIRNKFFAYFSFQTYSGSLIYNQGEINETYYLFLSDVTTGDTVNYIKHKFQKNLVFTYQLSDEREYGFLYPPKEIIPMGEGVLHSVKAMLKVAEYYNLIPSVEADSDSLVPHLVTTQ